MKRFFFTFAFTIYLQSFLCGQTDKDFSSTITKVTLFTQGAQIESETIVFLQQGPMTLKIPNLSPYIKKESIKVEGDGSFTIINVQHQNDYLNELERSKEIESLQNRVEEVESKIEDEETWITVFNDKLDFLKTNKEVNGKQQTINPETFKVLNVIYGDNLEKLNFDILKRERQIEAYKKEIVKLNNQLNSLNSKVNLASGTILISIDAKQTKTSKIKLNYLVDKALWYPSYDIRFMGVGKPLTVTYKANVIQNTGIDWKNVKLTLSTAKTNISAQIPTLNPFYLQFYRPVTQTIQNAPGSSVLDAIQGKVAGADITTSSGEAGQSPNITIRGNRSITAANGPLYIVDGVQYSSIQDIDPKDIESMEVLKDASSTAIYGSRGSNGVVIVTTKEGSDGSSIPTFTNSKRETSNEYEVDAKQTILSNSKTNTFTFKEADIEASFEYHSIPKMSENVYLIGKITDWYKADFNTGEVNLYLENSFVGKSLINTQQFTDTFEISFGVDNNISIKRTKVKEFLKSQIIGFNRKETVAYKLSIRNNKAYAIKAKIFDQIPISKNEAIEVETLELSGGKMEEETSMVKWEIDLKPHETKDILIKYSVKYPKDKKVLVD